MSKSDSAYGRLKALPIGTDFEDVATEGLEFKIADVKNNKDKPFGRMNTAVVMHFNESKAVEKNLKRLLADNRITPDMADHVKTIPVDRVFDVNKILLALVGENIGKSANAFTSTERFTEALEHFGLPAMSAEN